MDSYEILENGAEIARRYQQSTDSEEKKFLVMKVFTGVYFNLDRLLCTHNGEDFNSDFALFFYKKIPGLLRNYREHYSSFITYLRSYIKFTSRTFYQQQISKKNTDDAIFSEEQLQVLAGFNSLNSKGDYNIYAAESRVSYTKDLRDAERPKIKCRSKRASSIDNLNNMDRDRSFYFSMPYKNRLIFLLACKSCLFLDDEMVAKISREIDFPVERLEFFLEKLRQNCLNRQMRINKMLAKRNSHYIKMNAAKKFLDASDRTDTYAYFKNMKAHKGNYNGFERERLRDKKQIKFPSNRVIGEYLNISKSSVANNIEKALKELYT